VLAETPGVIAVAAREAFTTRPLLAAIEERLWREGRLDQDAREHAPSLSP